MSGSTCRFGPFLVDRAGYRVVRDGVAVALTPKLLDLLLYLIDRAGTLVTKEELLDGLWPGANVTDNALAQAVSELRQELGDEAAAPRFIKTIARRGYRFIAPVEIVETVDDRDTVERSTARVGTISGTATAIAVMDFVNVTGDPDSAWLSAGIAETVTGDLRALDRFRVVDRGRVSEAGRRTNGSLQAFAADLGVTLVVVGSFQRHGNDIRITGRIVNVGTGEALADAKVDGPFTDIFSLQDQVVTQFSEDLGLAPVSTARRYGSRETSSLEAYRALTEGWLLLETLDLRNIPAAIRNFERAVTVDPRYAAAYTGLASALLAAYEATRSDNVPARDLLDTAIRHARHAVALDTELAESHATLAFILVSAWETAEANRAARRAVALEPSNWRHFFRLGHASWGAARLRAADRTLALYPDFAFGHFQIAMVHVARGDLRDAETVLRQGAAVQDRQLGRGERYPALGLHWLLGLVRLACHDVEEALHELDRERALAEPHRLYGREFQMNALWATGACLLQLDRASEAADAFREALEIYPDHAQSHLGLSLALRAQGASGEAQSTYRKLPAILDVLAANRPIEAALVRSQMLFAEGDSTGGSAVLGTLLDDAPAGFAAWTVPVEPFLDERTDGQALAPILTRLAERAR